MQEYENPLSCLFGFGNQPAKHDELTDISKYELHIPCKDGNCRTCPAHKYEKRGKLDTRHAVLGGALLSTLIFGFPVFCLVCPIGLSFATILLIWRLFAAADLTWSVLLVPAILVVELVFLRKWCTRFCPIAGLMNLLSRFSHTWRPTIDDSKCMETSKGIPCSRCAIACDSDINIRHPQFGEHTMADCTRCLACVEACPEHAIFTAHRFAERKRSG